MNTSFNARLIVKHDQPGFLVLATLLIFLFGGGGWMMSFLHRSVLLRIASELYRFVAVMMTMMMI